VEGKKIRQERGLASRSHILRLDIAERSFVFFAKLGYGSAVCLEKRRGKWGGKKKMRESFHEVKTRIRVKSGSSTPL